MSTKSNSYWRGQPLSNLPREALERAANEAIQQVMSLAELERQRKAFDFAAMAFAGGALIAGLGALFGILVSRF